MPLIRSTVVAALLAVLASAANAQAARMGDTVRVEHKTGAVADGVIVTRDSASFLVRPADGHDTTRIVRSEVDGRVDSGAVLRVTTRDGALVKGAVVGWSAVSVTLAIREGNATNPSSFRLADIRKVEVRSVSRRTWRGALIGLTAGVVVGLVGTTYACSTFTGPGENYCGLGYVVSTPILGAMGAVAGAGIGAMMHRESWQHVQLAPP